MPYIKRNSSGMYRGKPFSSGTIQEVGPALYDSLTLNGRGTPSTKEEFEAQKKDSTMIEKIFNLTDEEVKTFDYQELKRKELEAFAVKVGVDVEVAEAAKNMDDLKALIKEKIEAE